MALNTNCISRGLMPVRSVLLLFTAALLAAAPFETAVGGELREASGRFNMSYIYFGSSGNYEALVDETRGSLDAVAPNYFDLNDDGTLKLTPAVDRGFINAMHERGILVTPFLSNHWDRGKGINALRNRETLASAVAAAVAEYNLDGVNVDIENVTESERDIYTDFVRLLREKLPEGKSVSVAVAPNPYGLKTGWHASYDYESLARYCDYLMLMTYDEHYQGSKPGPVAGYQFVENSIKAALKLVPADKLVLGIPFYGRYWRRGAADGGYGISNYRVEELVRDYEGKIVYDYSLESPRAVITISPADINPVVLGRKLEAGTYDIWFENEESIKRKLELAGKYGLMGTGSWSLGQEAKGTWDYYSLWLDGKYYSDIQSHWAKASIVEAIDNGWMQGVSGTRFMPEAPVTRAQAAVLIARMLDIGTPGGAGSKPTFVDVESHWARNEIEAVGTTGLFKGTGGERFEPDAALTREQLAVLLDRIINPGSRGKGENTDKRPEEQANVDNDKRHQGTTFLDVTPETSPWSCDSINRMASAGIIEGFPDGTFRPRNIISRGQMAALAARAYPHMEQEAVFAFAHS